MNYRNEAIRELQKIADSFPEYSLGEILFSSLQKEAVRNNTSTHFLTKISDEDVYTSIYKSIKKLENE